MEELLTGQFLWATLIAFTVIGIAVLTKVPELLVAMLIVGQDFIQYAVRLVGYDVSRRRFEVGGAVIFVPVVLLFLLMRMVQTREKEPLIGRANFPYVIMAVVLGLWLVFGVAYTPSERFYGAKKTTEYFIFGLTPMFLAFIFIQDRRAIRRLYYWIILVCASMALLVTAFSIARGTGIGGIMIFLGEDRPEQWGGIELSGHGALSTGIIAITACLLAMAASRKGLWWKLLPVLVLPVTAYYIVHAGTRSNLLVFGFVVTVGYFLAYRGYRWMFAVAILVIAIAGGLLITFSEQEVQDRMFGSWIEEGAPHGAGGFERVQILKHMPPFIAQKPVLGWGTGAWPVLYHHREWYAYPHNMFGEITIENGLVGLALLLSIWGIVLHRVWHHLRTAPPESELYGLAVFGTCFLAYEFMNASAHFGVAHASCTLLLTSAIILRATDLAEHSEEPDAEIDDDRQLRRPVLSAEVA